MPVVILNAADLGRTGYETREQLNADAELKARIERIRLAIGPKMNLGDVAKKVVPKMCLVAPPRAGGSICTRTFIPHDLHSAVGVLGAVTVATAAVLPGSVAAAVASVPSGNVKRVSVEHPTGEFTVELATDPRQPERVLRAALLRTARLLMRGEVLVPEQALGGSPWRPGARA
jgi:4-oxalomesaconate tautomerase